MAFRETQINAYIVVKWRDYRVAIDFEQVSNFLRDSNFFNQSLILGCLRYDIVPQLLGLDANTW